MPYEPPPYLSELTLEQVAEEVAQRKLPPLENWNPAGTGDSHIRIAADGRWFHEGSPIGREAMVRAFSTLLSRDEQGKHWLVTPTERLEIEVEDAAFVATYVAQKDACLTFRLNTDDLLIAGPEHRLRAAGSVDAPAIYLQVRRGCDARLNRSTWQQLAEIALAQGDVHFVESQGMRFSLLPQ